MESLIRISVAFGTDRGLYGPRTVERSGRVYTQNTAKIEKSKRAGFRRGAARTNAGISSETRREGVAESVQPLG